MKPILHLLVCIALLSIVPIASAQRPVPILATNDIGFEAIFDGKSLDGWQYDARYWRAENGCLVGEVTPETILKKNTFIIWNGKAPSDFELKVEYRITEGGNSGINYRSSWVTNATNAPFALKGYQADIDGTNKYTGQNYEERGREFLAMRGMATRIDADSKARIMASLGEKDDLAKFIKVGDWNEVHIIARGNVLTHIVNGHVMSIVVDDDTSKRTFDGLIGVQVHVGPPMKVEYRNFLLKRPSDMIQVPVTVKP